MTNRESGKYVSLEQIKATYPLALAYDRIIHVDTVFGGHTLLVFEAEDVLNEIWNRDDVDKLGIAPEHQALALDFWCEHFRVHRYARRQLGVGVLDACQEALDAGKLMVVIERLG